MPADLTQNVRVVPSGVIREADKRQLTEGILLEKWNALNGAPGDQTTPGDSGLIGSEGTYYRNYKNGGLYYDGGTVRFIWGAIGEAYRQLNGPQSWLGWPTSEEADYSEGGRFVKFEHGTIYWNQQTGPVAKKGAPFSVIGDISARYRELGGPTSWLGWPESNELDFADGGKISKFEHGNIYWWPDTGAIELNQVVVRYKGLYCYGETNDDGLSTADEPYVVFGIIPPPPATTSTFRTNFESKVDHGDSRPNTIDVYRGLPYGVAVTATLMEHDLADPDMYKDKIGKGVALAGTAITGAVTMIPGVGIVLGPLTGIFFSEMGGSITEEINEIIGGRDDILGMHGISFTPKDMIRLTKTPHLEWRGIQYHVETPLYDRQGASYKVYFDVVAA